MEIQGSKEKSEYTKRQKSDEFQKLFFCKSDEGVWLAQLDKPLPINLPIEQQEEHMLKHAFLSDCNLAFVKMYDYDNAQALIGARFPQLFDNSESSNLKNLRVFLQNNYQVRDIETIEIARNGQRKYFLNNVIGVIEDGCLIRVWGSQRDITANKSQQQILKQLTPEQLKILKITVEGKTMKEIASEVGVSPKTVESMRNQIKTILGVETIAQLIALAIQLGINDFVL